MGSILLNGSKDQIVTTSQRAAQAFRVWGAWGVSFSLSREAFVSLLCTADTFQVISNSNLSAAALGLMTDPSGFCWRHPHYQREAGLWRGEARGACVALRVSPEGKHPRCLTASHSPQPLEKAQLENRNKEIIIYILYAVCVLTAPPTSPHPSLSPLLLPCSPKRSKTENRPANTTTTASKCSRPRESRMSLTLNQKLEKVKLSAGGISKAKLGLLNRTAKLGMQRTSSRREREGPSRTVRTCASLSAGERLSGLHGRPDQLPHSAKQKPNPGQGPGSLHFCEGWERGGGCRRAWSQQRLVYEG